MKKSTPEAWPIPGIAGGRKANDLRLGQSRELAIHRCDDGFRLQGRGTPLVVGREQAEVETVAGALSLREDAVAGDRVVVADARLVLEDLVDLPHHRGRALQRRGFGQLDVHDEVALVFVRQKRPRQDPCRFRPPAPRSRPGSRVASSEPSDEQAGDTDVALLHAREARVESARRNAPAGRATVLCCAAGAAARRGPDSA